MSKLPSISTIVASTSKMKKSRLNDSSSPPLGVSTSAVSASSEDNFNPVPSLTILSNILTSTGKIRPDHSHPNEEELPRKPSRGKYKCGRCGKPKENHVCTMVDECVLTYSLGIQTGPCTLAHYGKFCSAIIVCGFMLTLLGFNYNLQRKQLQFVGQK